MSLLSRHRIISLLGLAVAVSSAPLNERAHASRGLVGWLCHYDGPPSPVVDASLDLPAMLGALCAKVNYDYPGCESFDPNRPDSNPVQPPQDDGTGVQSASVDQFEDQDDGEHKPSKHKKAGKHHPEPSAQSASASEQDDNNLNHEDHKHKKGKKPHHDGGNDDDGNPVNAHSFHGSDGNEPKSSHHPPGPEPHESSPEQDPNSAVGSLSNGESDDVDAHGCQPNELYSSELDRCVDQSYFSQPQSDGTCQKGAPDEVLNLCLDVSTLGLTDPIHAEATVLNAPGAAGDAKCPSGQQYSSLLSVCIENTFFANPSPGDQCPNGWILDLILGHCLDLAGCRNQSRDS